MKDRQAALAIEGGGSTGKAALDHRGVILSRIVPCGLNPTDMGYATFEKRLRSLVLPLLSHLDAKLLRIHACAAVAGAGDPAIAGTCGRILSRLLTPFARVARVNVMSDVGVLVECFLEVQDGIVLIAGTGSVCLGVKHIAGGRITTRVGGWGGYLDRGSGFRMGMRVLEAALQALDGRAPVNATVNLMCERYEIDLKDVAPRFVQAERAEIAKLALIALEAYSLGDPFARSLVHETARDLGDMVLAAKSKGGLRGLIQVVLSGGLLRAPIVARLVRRRIKQLLPKANLHHVDEPLIPILGLARHLSGVRS